MSSASGATNAFDAVSIPSDRYDRRTMLAKVWVTADKRYRWVRSIDAREYVFRGSATFYKPGDEPADSPVRAPQVNPTIPPARNTAASRPASPSLSALPAYPFAAHNVSELQVFAQEAGIDNYEELRKDRLVAALITSGYRPVVT